MTAVTVRKEQVVAVVMLKVIGAVTFEHGYAPIKANLRGKSNCYKRAKPLNVAQYTEN